MHIEAFQTPIIHFGDNLLSILDSYLPALKEEDIIAITSKIVSVCEGRFVDKGSLSKIELIEKEADAMIEGVFPNPYNMHLTIKEDILIPCAGIDESNSENGYILYPSDVQKSAQTIWKYLRLKHHINKLGIIITDSHTTPMRRGVTGITLGFCGFYPLYNYIGKDDLFGRTLQVTFCNLVDALSTAAVLVMGEGKERTPIARIQNAPKMTFLDRSPTQEEKNFLHVPMNEDIYYPLLSAVRWKTRKM